MAVFHLTVATPDGSLYNGEAEALYLRGTEGDLGILPNHMNFAAAIGMGHAKVVTSEGTKNAACIGGLVVVRDNEVSVAATTWEWAENIDLSRAERAEEKARKILEKSNISDSDLKYAEAKLKRALVRKSVGTLR